MAKRRRRAATTPQQTVAQIIAAQLRPLDYGQGRAVAEQKAEQARLGATTRAVIAALQAGVKPVQATYDNALQQQQALAQNAARLLSGANPNAATQADLAAVNAPAEQRAQQAAQANAQFGGQAGVLYTQQGSIPGASLVATRQADLAHLAGMPTLAALQSGESLRGLQATAKRQRDQYLASRMSVAGQAPQLLSQLQQQAVDNAYRQQQAQTAIQQAALDRQFQAQQAELNRRAQFAITPYQQAQLRLDQQRLDASVRSTRTSAAAPRIIGSSGSGYYSVGPGGKLHSLLPATGPSGGGRTKAFEATRTKVEEVLGLLPGAAGGSIFGGGGGGTSNTLGVPLRQRNRAYTKLYGLYAPPLLRAGVTKRSVKAMINTALNQAGYALPGRRINSRGQRVGP